MFDRKPLGQQTEDDLTGGTYETQVFNMYAKLRGFHLTSGNTALAIHGMRSEDAEKGSTLSDGAATGKMFDDFEYLASNGMIKSYWNDNYSLIHKVNDLLDEMSQNPSLTEGDLVNKGEALFVRAFCYFNLVRAFGEVPLIDFKVYDAAEANVPKSSVAKIYELIDSDLTEAENSLPRTWEQLYVGRLTWGAARSLHARTYMMRNDWGNMKAAAEEVINSGLYNLKTPYEDIFREKGENCSESVFELQCTATESQPGSNDIGSQLLPFRVYVAQASGISVGGNTPLLKNWQMLLKREIREKTKLCFILYATARTIQSPYLLTSLMVRNLFRMLML